MGTYQVQLSITSVTGDFVDGGTFYRITTLESGVVNFAPGATAWIIDGAPGISFAQLPAGFTPLTCDNNFGVFLSGVTIPAQTFWTITDVMGNTADRPLTSTGGITPAPSAVSLNGISNISASMNNVIGQIRVQKAITANTYGGTYDILSVQATLSPPSGSEVEVNQVITIESNPANGGVSLAPATGVVVNLNGTPVDIITQSATSLTFAIPPELTNTVITVTLTSSTSFSGTIDLGSLIVLAANGSGIYVITPGQFRDILYSSNRDGTTWDARIPDPFIKSGLIRG